MRSTGEVTSSFRPAGRANNRCSAARVCFSSGDEGLDGNDLDEAGGRDRNPLMSYVDETPWFKVRREQVRQWVSTRYTDHGTGKRRRSLVDETNVSLS